MTIKNGIRPNEELYGDFELIPLNLDAVQQRIDFFRAKVHKYLFEVKDDEKFKLNYDAWNFWKEMKAKHCEVSDDYGRKHK